jgi:3-methyladenine DNA glycosylase AlkD
MIQKIKTDLKKASSQQKAKILSKFFKCGKGEYGEGDKFIGITVPEQRKIAQKYSPDLSLIQTEELLQSKIHEHRLTALLILIEKFSKSKGKSDKKKIIQVYLKNTKCINNWDLVDLSAPKILGQYLLKNPKEKNKLYVFAKSKDLWKKRIAIISTYTFIKNNKFKDTLKISEILLQDKHDLIHKAVGWMLREIGKVDLEIEEKFLKKYYKKMPRTMLRYSIEKFPENKRQKYLKGKI